MFCEAGGTHSTFSIQNSKLTSRQGLERKPRKGGGFGAQGAAERPEEATVRDHEPHSQRLRSCSGKPDGEQSEPGRPNNSIIIYNNTTFKYNKWVK